LISGREHFVRTTALVFQHLGTVVYGFGLLRTRYRQTFTETRVGSIGASGAPREMVKYADNALHALKAVAIEPPRLSAVKRPDIAFYRPARLGGSSLSSF